jgi:hypothetical protein
MQIFYIDTLFHEMVPSFVHFLDTHKLRMMQGLEGQIELGFFRMNNDQNCDRTF